MKKLALLMFAIMILGCGNETTVVEEPEPIIEEPPPITQVSAPNVILGEHFRFDPGPVWIEHADIIDGAVDVDPEPFNLAGIHIELGGFPILSRVDLRIDGGVSLRWLPRGVVADHAGIGNHIWIKPVEGGPLLEFDTAYIITVYAQNVICESTFGKIQFRTKRKP